MRTSRRGTRNAGALLAATAITAVALTGCASWGISQRGWAGDLERSAGVVSVDWSYDSGFLTTGPRYTGELILSPDLTEAEAVGISEASCSAKTEMHTVRIATEGSALGSGSVEMSVDDGACIDPDALLAFARAAAASRALGPGFPGDFTVLGIVADSDDASPDAATGAPESEPLDRAGSVRINVSAPESGMLIDALRELHARSKDRPLDLSSTLTASLSTSTGITAYLEPGDDLAPMLPVLQAAFDVPHGVIRATGEGVSVELLTTTADADASVAELRDIADRAGVDLSTPLPRMDADADPARESALVDELTGVPGGATVAFPARASGGEIEVRTADLEGTAAAANILAHAGELRASFRVLGPDPKRFWIALRPMVEPPESFDAAVTTAMTAERELAEVDRVILDLTRGTTDLTVIMQDTVSRNAAADAQRLLQTAARSGSFDEVRLRTPWTDFDQEVVE